MGQQGCNQTKLRPDKVPRQMAVLRKTHAECARSYAGVKSFDVVRQDGYARGFISAAALASTTLVPMRYPSPSRPEPFDLADLSIVVTYEPEHLGL